MLTKINSRIKRRQKGFTLIELLLVVAILAVLAFLAVPAIASTIRNARTRTCGANERTIEQGIWRWYADQVAVGRIVTPHSPLEGGIVRIPDISSGTPAGSDFDDLFIVEPAVGVVGFDAGLDPIGRYFTPGGLPACAFEVANTYAVELLFADSGLEDIIVQCTGTIGLPADVHPRAADRTRRVGDLPAE